MSFLDLDNQDTRYFPPHRRVGTRLFCFYPELTAALASYYNAEIPHAAGSPFADPTTSGVHCPETFIQLLAGERRGVTAAETSGTEVNIESRCWTWENAKRLWWRGKMDGMNGFGLGQVTGLREIDVGKWERVLIYIDILT